MDFTARESGWCLGLGRLSRQREFLEIATVLIDPWLSWIDPRPTFWAELMVFTDHSSAVVAHVSCQFASSRGRYSATVLPLFMIRQTETWTSANLLGAAFLLAVLVIVITWAFRRYY